MNEKRILEVKPVLPPDAKLAAFDRSIPQWPYIFAQVAKEKETNATRTMVKLIAIVLLLGAVREGKEVFDQFSYRQSEGEWALDVSDFTRWEEALQEIL